MFEEDNAKNILAIHTTTNNIIFKGVSVNPSTILEIAQSLESRWEAVVNSYTPQGEIGVKSQQQQAKISIWNKGKYLRNLLY